MTNREAHLAGSLPGPTAEAAMSTALEILGPYLRTLPDGETGERRNWIVSIIEGLLRHPDLELRKPGDWSGYDKTPVLKIRKGHKLYGASLDFGHVDAVRSSFPNSNGPRLRRGGPTWPSRRACPATSTWPRSPWARSERYATGGRSPKPAWPRSAMSRRSPERTRFSRSRCRWSWCC